ncbi:MAG: 50S ribosomal protein L27 [Candidatus Harrisonbacteria bacterium RIFCSPLOWO2_01_FULL_40_28]|uniref:Large ribosomal subunit protein bL27 n=2 Tax=Candidatus Harrisoniibacteriota TaxID=1817905 RepID=A0A1G1ZYE9_9BACT|nr:MAG: 50S ribosomal protein L27 [Candidatus Harrisonbacteria bacterium RIFCSPLOWO2_01_FULL_40_28]OGY69643.1 MAG: 50S ribosomal protein L27 [Candidatus Harrisonbacteria bacterium RIFOXYD1_FULL_40_9]
MAHTKSGGSTKLGRDSASQRLGLKVNHGEVVGKGEIIVRQRGTRFIPGLNTKQGSDDTIYAHIDGVVKITNTKKLSFNRSFRYAKIINVVIKEKSR